jgi:hypothetical protein
MEFNVLDRALLLNTLPTTGDFTTLTIIRKLREEMSFSEDDHKVLKFSKNGDSQIRWDADGVIQLGAKEVEIGPKATEIIRETLIGLDKAKQLTVDHLDLYERFVANTSADS